VVGVLTALVVADLTNGTGRFNLAQGLVGTASGIGASLSTALFGVVAVSFGRTVVFLSIAAAALVAVLDSCSLRSLSAQAVFQATDGVRDPTFRLLGLAFRLKLGIAENFSGGLLHRALGLLGQSFDSILIHERLLCVVAHIVWVSHCVGMGRTIMLRADGGRFAACT
jgi:hypothetical protein